MQSALWLYTKFLVLLVVLAAVIAFNLVVWGVRRYPEVSDPHVPVARVERGRLAIDRYGCGSCHVIPGIPEATGRVGPQLQQFAEQVYIAGVLTNTPQNLTTWIRAPKQVDPLTAMPNLGVSLEESRDIAAYLYTLR